MISVVVSNLYSSTFINIVELEYLKLKMHRTSLNERNENAKEEKEIRKMELLKRVCQERRVISKGNSFKRVFLSV